MADPTLFSQEWCDGALEVSNASEGIYKGFKDAPSFTNVLVFEITDKNLVCSVEYVAGLIKSWTAADSSASATFSRFAANLDVWKTAADGKAQGSQLLMAGKIKLRRGPLAAAIENAPAFNAFLVSWGAAPGDWNI